MKRLGKLNPEQLMVVRFVNRMFGWFIWVVAAGQGVDTWMDEVCDERRNQASSRNHDANEAHRQ